MAKKKKWGKVGSPKSSKRRRHLKRIALKGRCSHRCCGKKRKR